MAASGLENLKALQQRAAKLAQEHGAAVMKRSAALCGDFKELDAADKKVRDIEAALSSTENLIAEIRNAVAFEETQVAAKRDLEQREKRAKEIEAHMPAIMQAFADVKPVLEKFIAALRAGSDGVADCVPVADYVEQFIAVVTPELDRLAVLTEAQARLACHPVVTKPTKPAGPELTPQPWRRGDPVGSEFIDFDDQRAGARR